MTKISIINATTVLKDEEVRACVAALQIQCDRDFMPFWDQPVQLGFLPKGQPHPRNDYWLVLMDTADVGGALGYHDTTSAGRPLGKVFVKTALQYGDAWTVTTSHELLEMIVDPEINLTVDLGGGKFQAYEVCDACENDRYGYTINDVLVSDFVTPAYFASRHVAGAQHDFGRHIGSALQLLPGGYASVWTPQGGWTQEETHATLRTARRRPLVGSRRERRRTVRGQWQRSMEAVRGDLVDVIA